MTDDPNELEPESASDAEAAAEAADDLDDAQLEAAAEGAKDELEDDDVEVDEEDVEPIAGIETSPVVAAGAPGIPPEVRGPRVRGPKPTRTAFAIDPALRIHDRASAIFVLVSVGVFVLILANAMLFGRGGAFTPIPTASPIPTLAAESPSAGPSSGASESPGTSPGTSPGASNAPSSGASPAAS